MTDDIVARLALHANVRSTPDSVSAVLLEARNEIELLRATLRRIDSLNDNPACFNPDIDIVIYAALAPAREKDNEK